MKRLIQTDRIIKTLVDAGFKRSEISVNTPFCKRLGGYDLTKIYVKVNDQDRHFEILPRLLATREIKVVVWVRNNGSAWFLYYDGCGNGKLEVVNLDELEESIRKANEGLK